MKIIKLKKITSLLAVFFLMLGIYSYIHFAYAEDDDERDGDYIINTSPDNNTGKKSETQTNTVKLSDTVTETTITINRYDSDGDGIYDDEDKYPAINDYFIVKDDNRNGIDDQYE